MAKCRGDLHRCWPRAKAASFIGGDGGPIEYRKTSTLGHGNGNHLAGLRIHMKYKIPEPSGQLVEYSSRGA